MIGVCMVTNDAYYQTKYCIENLVAKTNVKLRLNILDNGSKDERLISYLTEVCEVNKWYLKRLEIPVSLAKAYNIIAPTIYQEYCCLFPINCIVNKNWAEDLITNHTLCNNAGVIGIRNGSENIKLEPVLFNCETKDDYFQNVWVSENSTVEGVVMFKRQSLFDVGVFDERLNAGGLEVNEISFRYVVRALRNFYIPKQTCVKVNIENEILFPKRTKDSIKNLMEAIDIMIKTRQFKK